MDTTTVGSNNLNLANTSLSWNDPTHQTNQARQSLSGIVYANVYTPPRITTTPASASILRGESAVFTVSLTGGYNVADNNTITLIDPNAATDGLSITSTPSLCVLGQTVSSCIFTIHASSSAPIASNTLSVSNSNHDISTTPTSISVVVTPRYYPFFFPWGITLNSAGTIAFITNQNSNIVTQCSVFESTLSSCTNSGATGLYRPGVIVLNSTGDIAFITVGDVPAFQCSVSAGNLSNCANSGATGILNSGGIVLSPDETLAFITNSSGGNIGSYHLSGSTLSGYVYSGATNLSNPSFIVLNQSGSTAFITNWGNNTVTQCSVNGGTLSNCTNSGATGLNNPTGIVLNSAEDIIFIVNTGNNTVTQCSVNGSILSNCSNSGATGLSWPGGIVLNSSGTLAFITSPSNDGTADGKIIQCSVNGGTLSNCAQTGIID